MFLVKKAYLIGKISALIFVMITISLTGCASTPPPPQNVVAERSVEVTYPDHFEMEFVFIEGGCFQMGCPDSDETCREIEKPKHEACVESFWMAKHEVTQLQFMQFKTEHKKSRFSNTHPVQINKEGFTRTFPLYGPEIPLEESDSNLWNHPATNVSWYAAKSMAEWLSINSDFHVRLPTEAEWEYSCKAGTKDYQYGTKTGEWSNEIANYTSIYDIYAQIKSFPVASFSPNAFGVHDLSGNVYEWCEDWLDKTYYNRSPVYSPLQLIKSDYKVVRGGAHASVAYGLKCTTRHGIWPDVKSSDTGLRLVIVPDDSHVPKEGEAGSELILRVEADSLK